MPATPSTATITIPIAYTDFHEANAKGGMFCEIETMTCSGDSRVSINPTNNSVQINPVAGVTTSLDLIFTLSPALGEIPPAGQRVVYSIMGIFFTGVNSNAVFGAPSGDGSNSVTIPDALNTVGNWDFVVVVNQVVSAGDGSVVSSKIGIIDPPIDNDLQ